MKIYNCTDTISFGKFAGRTIESVWMEDPSYIKWCLANLEHFKLSSEAESALQEIKPYDLSEVSKSIIDTEEEPVSDPYDYNYDVRDDEWQEDDGRERSFGRYAGSYAQDVEGWSDEDIDDVFDGDPDNYWNID